MVEHCLAKAGVAGSNPVSRSMFFLGNSVPQYMSKISFIEVLLVILISCYHVLISLAVRIYKGLVLCSCY